MPTIDRSGLQAKQVMNDTPPENHDDGPDTSEGTLLSHLVELRDRLLRMVVAIVICFILLIPFASEVFGVLAAPLLRHLPQGTNMIATEVASPFLTPFKLAFISAVFLSMPVILYQAWSFIAPGLYQQEKRFGLPLLVSSIVLFYLGSAFAYFVVFPLIFGFFSSIEITGVSMMTDIRAYLDFVLALFLAFGIAFEVPIATLLMVKAGLVTPNQLKSKRPYVFLGAFVVGMFLTPPDAISQTLLAVPVYLLYEFGIFISRILVPGVKEVEEQQRSAGT